MVGDQDDAPVRAAALAAARYAGLSLPEQPRLAPWVVTVDLGDGRLQFRSAESSHTLEHRLLVRAFHDVEKHLDGQHAVEDIVSQVGSAVEPTTVVFLLKLLHGKGLLQHGGELLHHRSGDDTWVRQVRFLSHFVPNATKAQAELEKSRVGVTGHRGLRQGIITALNSIGIVNITEMREPPTWRTESAAESDGLDVVIACDVSPGFALFDAVNRACLAARTRWLRVVIAGTSAQLGPTFVPYETACYTCLDLRRQTHENDVDGYLAYRNRADGADACDDGASALSTVVSGQVALEIMRILVGHAAPVTFGRYYDLSAKSPLTTPHDVLKVPRCPSCSSRRTFAEAWDQTALPTVR